MLSELLERAPSGARAALARLLNFSRQPLRLFPAAALLCGRGRCGSTLKVLAAGKEEDLLTLQEALFAGRPHRLRLGRVFLYAPEHVPGRARLGADLAAAAPLPVLAPYWTRRGWFLLPKWVHFTCDTAHAGEDFLKRSGTLGDDVRRLLCAGFGCRVVKEPGQISRYYEEVYRPYISEKFGARAELPGPGAALALAGRGGLLLVSRRGEPAAGVIFAAERGRFRLKMAAPFPSFARTGAYGGLAMTAMYFFSLRQARDLGYGRVDFGGCRPFLSDGLFSYKRKWRMRVEPRAGLAPDLAFKILRLSPGVRAFLAANPFVCRDGDGLRGQVFLDAPPPAGPERAQRCRGLYQTEGLSELRVVSGSEAPRP